MATPLGQSSLGPSLPPPSPKSPPKYPDLHGKRREIARVHMLEKEISVLQDELKFTEGLQPASDCCKELVDFVVANADPLIPTNKKKRRLYRRFWKWLCRMPSWKLYWICSSYQHGDAAASLVLNQIAVNNVVVVATEIVASSHVVASLTVLPVPLAALANALALALVLAVLW
ncbi:hypothetical protein K1719_005774 [Acacia pycnantha]|nr:hypothetical protein K1719_005774 [Acacia pycnantha]